MPPAELSKRIALLAGEEAIAQSGIGRQGPLSRTALFIALPPLEIEWPYRVQIAETAAPTGEAGYPDLLRVAREPQFAPISDTLKYGIIGEHLAEHFGTEGSPISLNDSLRLRRDARSSSASRRSGAANATAALAIGADGSLTPESLVRFSLLSALSTQNDPPEQASKPFSKNRDGFVLAEGAARAGARGSRSRPRARRASARHPRRLRREIRLLPPHPLEPGRQADHRLHAQGAGRRRRRRRRRRLHQRARHLDARERQDGASRRLGRVRRAHPRHPDLVEQIDDRPYA